MEDPDPPNWLPLRTVLVERHPRKPFVVRVFEIEGSTSEYPFLVVETGLN